MYDPQMDAQAGQIARTAPVSHVERVPMGTTPKAAAADEEIRGLLKIADERADQLYAYLDSLSIRLSDVLGPPTPSEDEPGHFPSESAVGSALAVHINRLEKLAVLVRSLEARVRV